MAGGQINFKVGYTVDKTGLQAVKASIQEIMNMKSTGTPEFNQQLEAAKESARALSNPSINLAAVSAFLGNSVIKLLIIPTTEFAFVLASSTASSYASNK